MLFSCSICLLYFHTWERGMHSSTKDNVSGRVCVTSYGLCGTRFSTNHSKCVHSCPLILSRTDSFWIGIQDSGPNCILLNVTFLQICAEKKSEMWDTGMSLGFMSKSPFLWTRWWMFTFVSKFKALKIYQRGPDEGHHETISFVLQLIKISLAQKTVVLSLPRSVRGTVMIVGLVGSVITLSTYFHWKKLALLRWFLFFINYVTECQNMVICGIQIY